MLQALSIANAPSRSVRAKIHQTILFRFHFWISVVIIVIRFPPFMVPIIKSKPCHNLAEKKFFQKKLSDKYSEKFINNITKTNKPFLCDPHTNFRKLVGENLGEEYAKIYGLYSQAIHPSVNDFYMNEGIWQTIPEILLLILEEYLSLIHI